MGDFLSNLVVKSRGGPETIHPRPSALFEAAAATTEPAAPAATSDEGWREAAPTVTTAGRAPDRRNEDVFRRPSASPGSVSRERRRSAEKPRPETGPRIAAADRPIAAPRDDGPPYRHPEMDGRVTPTSGSDTPTRTEEDPIPLGTDRGQPTETVPEAPAEVRSAEGRSETGRGRPESEIEAKRHTAEPTVRPIRHEAKPAATVAEVTRSVDPRPSPLDEQSPMAPAGSSRLIGDQARPVTPSVAPAETVAPPRLIAPGEISGAARQAIGREARQEDAESPPSARLELGAAFPDRRSTEIGPPTIQVRIGRVEVRAVTPPTRERQRATPSRSDSVLTLEAYLEQRNEEPR